MQIVDAIVRAYVNLWAVQRPPVHAALTALLSALAARAVALQVGHCATQLSFIQKPVKHQPINSYSYRLIPL